MKSTVARRKTIASLPAAGIMSFATWNITFKAFGTSQERAQTKNLEVNGKVIVSIHFKIAAIALTIVLVLLAITHTR